MMTNPPTTLKDHVARMASVPLVAQPGDKWIYADGHSVLARLFECWSGQPYDAFLDEHLFRPLGMVDTGYIIPESKRGRLVANYAYDKAKKMVPFSAHPMGKFMNDAGLFGKPRALSGSGGLASTLYDYWRFAQMLANKGELDGVRILGTKTVEFMSMNHLPNNGNLTTMGVSSFTETTMEGVGFGLGVGVCIDARSGS